MVRIGIVTRCDQTGLGIQGKEFFDNIPCKALVIDVSPISQSKQNLDWYPNQMVYRLSKLGQGTIPEGLIIEFIKDIDVLITFENPYDYNIFDICRKHGVKTILQLNYEFLEYPSNLPSPDLFLAPSLWHYDDIPNPKWCLEVPVNLNHFTPIKKHNTFVHIVGKTAVYNRNGTDTVMKCLRYVKSPIKLVIRSQQRIDFAQMANGDIPYNVSLIISHENRPNYYDNYDGGVLIMPRKYGGLSLVYNEAIAAEMPIISTDISPNNIWMPKEWLVPATKKLTFKCKQQVDVYEADLEALAAKVDEYCDKVFYEKQVSVASDIKRTISWDKLKPDYYRLFEDLCK